MKITIAIELLRLSIPIQESKTNDIIWILKPYQCYYKIRTDKSNRICFYSSRSYSNL